MRRPVDFKRLNLSPSDHALMKKWSRVVVAIYASAAIVGTIAAFATGTPRIDNVTAQKMPPVVTFDRN